MTFLCSASAHQLLRQVRGHRDEKGVHQQPYGELDEAADRRREDLRRVPAVRDEQEPRIALHRTWSLPARDRMERRHGAALPRPLGDDIAPRGAVQLRSAERNKLHLHIERSTLQVRSVIFERELSTVKKTFIVRC